MAFYDAITDFIFVEDQPKHADLIFIPGGACGEIAQRAAALYLQGYASRILVSGKYSTLVGSFPGPASPPSYVNRSFSRECDFLSQVLIDCGIPSSSIIKEEQATFTYENAIFSRKQTDSLSLSIRRGILCCQAYHARRCLLYYQLLYPDTTFFVCPAVTWNTSRENWTRSPESIDRVLGEVERCGSQFHEILKNPLSFL